MRIDKSFQKKKSNYKFKTSKKNNRFLKYGGGKEELLKQLKDTESEILCLEMSVAYGSQTATGYKMYVASSKVLNDNREALQKEYDQLFTPQELSEREAQIAREQDMRKKQHAIEMEQKAGIEIDRLAACAIRDNERRIREQAESARMRSWIDTSLQQYEEHVKDLISSNSQNKEFLVLELTKLESDWDVTTRFGQPTNAAYLYKTYTIKKNLLIDAIQKL